MSCVPSRRPRILICDDESHIARAAAMKLGKANFEIEIAADGQFGWEAVLRCPPDLIITDYQMPRLNGLELCRRLRQLPEMRDLPVILLTAKGYEYDWDELAQDLWLTRILVKPFSPRELLQIVQETLQVVGATPHE